MASHEELYQALRNADAAGDVEGAKKLAAYIQSMPAEQAKQPEPADPLKAGRSAGNAVMQNIGNLVGGLVRGAGSIGSTILAPYDMAKDAVAGKGLSLESSRERRAAIDGGLQTLGAEPDSLLYKAGKLGGEIAGTAGAGGVVANGMRAVAPAMPAAVAASPRLAQLISAAESSGFTTGAPAATNALGKAIDMGIRMAGGGVTGGAAAGLINPEDAWRGAALGAALPPAVAGTGAATRYVGRTAASLIKPFTEAGQTEIAGKVLRKFADGGPISLNAAEIVPGSMPTLAEATGNAGIATLQRGARDLRPNAFVERETQNATARNALFDSMAGDENAIRAAAGSREDAANALYGKAFSADAMRRDVAQSAKDMRSPFVGAGLSGAGDDLATPGLRGLARRPAFQQAVEQAKALAANNGVRLNDPLQSLEGLHYVKLALDDMAKPGGATSLARNEGAAIGSMQAKLAGELEKVSPLYANARKIYAEMSQPINAMETLQGLKLTDSKGNITLAKVQSALDNLQARMSSPKIDSAKSVTAEQINSLTAIRDDLLRQSNLGLGRSVGSNTFQNLATNNILNTMAGNTLTKLADKVGISGVLGQVGQLAYSRPNEAIRNRLVDMMLEPQLAEKVLAGAPQVQAPNALARLMLNPTAGQFAYRSAPALATSR